MLLAQGLKTITVAATGADYTTVQAAVNAAPETGAVIRIRPGVYREVLHVDKPKIQLRGDTDDPSKVVLVFGNSAASTCGTSCSATLFVTGSDFFASSMTIANDYSKTNDVPSQAVALAGRGDRAVFRRGRAAGGQRTRLVGGHPLTEDPTRRTQPRRGVTLLTSLRRPRLFFRV